MAETLYSIPVASIKMRWKEPYVTDGLNKKTAVAVPRGCYRGFGLAYDDITPGGNYMVKLAGDPTQGDHVAVYETDLNHHSLLVRWDVGDQLLNLNLPALLGNTVVIALFATYVVGATTTAEVRAYTLAQYNAAAEKAELIVLGTVAVPAAPAPIPATDITHTRRMEPWSELAPGAVFWSPLLKNSSFEWGVTGETADAGEFKEGLVPFWGLQTYMGAGTASLGSTDAYPANSGSRCVLFKTTTGAAVVSQVGVGQDVGAPVEVGKKVRVRFYVNVLQAMTGGSAAIYVTFWDKTGAIPGGTPVQISVDLSAITGGWVEYDETFEVPTGCAYIKNIAFVFFSGSFAAAADSVLVDDFQAWVETGDPLKAFEFAEKVNQPLWAKPLFIGQWSGFPAFSRLAAQLRFFEASPSGEGDLIITSRDEDPAVLPPRLTQKGRMQLGEGLLSSLTDSLKARIAAKSSTSAIGSRTLIYEGQRSDAGTNGVVRIYLTTATPADLEITTNARWDGAQWNRDVVANSFRYTFGGGSFDGYTVETYLSTDASPWAVWRVSQRSGAGYGISGIELGEGWLDTAANADSPRELAFRATTVVSDRTMISMLAGQAGTGNPYAVCVYRGENISLGEVYELAFNCTWVNSTSKWKQTNTLGSNSTVFRFHEYGFQILSVSGSHPVDWDELSWDNNLKFLGLNPISSIPYTNTVTQLNPCKAWGLIDDTASGGPFLQDGFNISSVSVTATEIKVTFATPMATALAGLFSVTVANWIRNPASRGRNVIVKQSTASWVEFEVVNTTTGALIDPSAEETKFSFAVHARQNSFP